MSSLNLKIVSFDKTLYSKSVEMVVLPGAFGDISISSMGRYFAYVLKSGTIYVFEGNEKKRFFIQQGRFVSSENEIIVSIDGDLFDLDNLDLSGINKLINKYEELLKNESNNIKHSFYINKVHFYNSLINSSNIVLYK